jgi:hypothetical protein
MSEPKKYVTFRDLRDLPNKDQSAQDSTSPSIPSSTSISSNTSISSIPNEAQPSEATQKKGKKTRPSPLTVAPERDFQRVPNSVTRRALPDGVFRGKSKQVWDYLWSVSRGAVVPKRVVRKARKEIKTGAGLGSMVTVDAAIEHLQHMGLLAVRPAVGSLSGNEYEVFSPEESQIVRDRFASISSTSRYTSLTQNLDDLDVLDSSISSTTLIPLESKLSGFLNTSLNTHDDDTHTLLSEFAKVILDAAQTVVGRELPTTEKERILWKECGCVLADELKRAAARTESVSSVPAFFASHLRRRFATSARNQSVASPDAHDKPTDPVNRHRNRRDKESVTPARPETQVSKFSLEECRRYADHLHKSGQGINNPGGYATMIYRSGEADALLERFLTPDSADSLDRMKCPDCRGTGFIYPEGIERGIVARCKHERLPVALAILTHIEQLRSLHSAEEGYGPEALKEDLQYRCQRNDLAWDEDLIQFLLGKDG